MVIGARKPFAMTSSTHTASASSAASTASLGVALVTGASSGIGALYADRLARRGYDLILVARNAQRLDALAQRLQADTGRQVTPLVADLNQRADLARVEALLRSDARITLLVNNAGVGSVHSILDADVEAMDAMIQLNITALTRLTYAVAPGFVARGQGTIINIASIVAIAPEYLNGVYSASKSYVLTFGHKLQQELAPRGVRVQTVLPGSTATEFWDVAGHAAQKDNAITMRADHLVDAALAGLDQGETVTIPNLHDGEAWTRWEDDRRALASQFGNALPAPRYGIATE